MEIPIMYINNKDNNKYSNNKFNNLYKLIQLQMIISNKIL